MTDKYIITVKIGSVSKEVVYNGVATDIEAQNIGLDIFNQATKITTQAVRVEVLKKSTTIDKTETTALLLILSMKEKEEEEKHD